MEQQQLNRRRASPLRMARVERCLRLFDVAVATGLSEATLSRAERQERSLRPDELRRVAKFYGTAPETLIGREGAVA